jgi:hypothetical protein
VSIKLGDHTVVLVKSVEDWNDRDDYGNPVKGRVYRQVHWCQVTPTRASEDQTRQSPAITGANLLAPPSTFGDVVSADAILWPWEPQPDGKYTGTQWEILGDIGRWDEAIDCQLRRLT